MSIPRFATLVVALAAIACPSFSGDAAFSPGERPLAVVRADSAADAVSVLKARQFAVLGLDRRDFAGEVPGLAASVPSLRSLLENMAGRECADLWYAVMQKGGTAASRTGIAGFSLKEKYENAEGAEDIETLLKDMGLLLGAARAETRPGRDGKRNVVIFPDALTLQDSQSGSESRDREEAWRGSLANFLERPGQGIRAWINPRPLLGLLTLLGGFDLRGVFNRYSLSSPSAVRAELFAADADLGLSLSLDHLVPNFPRGGGGAYILGCGIEKPILEINLPIFDRLWRMANVNIIPFLFANINILALVPRSVTITAWRNDAGRLAWAAVALLPGGGRSLGQLRRVEAWLEYLSGISPDTFGSEAAESRWGDRLRRIRVSNVSCVMGTAMVETEHGENTAVILSGDVGDWPNPFDFKAERTDSANVCVWRANLDAEAKREAAASLAGAARRHGREEYSEALFLELLADADSGYVRLDGESLTILSRRGLLPLLIPGVVETVARRLAVTEDLFAGVE